jgi:release factor glutamine methyltransferase
MPEHAPATWRKLLLDAEEALGAGGVENGPREARWMLEELAGVSEAELQPQLGDVAPGLAATRLGSMLQRRLAGEPLQYVLGSWSFRSLDLAVDRRVLIPRPETEVVAGAALDELDRMRRRSPSFPLRAVDLGTGSGAIGLSLAFEREWVEVVLTDESSDALAVAAANLAGIGRRATRVSIAQGPWFAAVPAWLRGELDLVVSNPPYVAAGEVADLPAEVRDWEPVGALVAGERGTEDLEHLVDTAPEWLVADGALVLELAPHQADAMATRAREAGFGTIDVRPDLTGRPRALVARR